MLYKKNLIKIITNLSLSEIYTYHEIKELMEPIKIKLLHRLMTNLHNEGYITIQKNNKFKLEEKKPKKRLVFVYGSLKRNFDNHYIIEKAKYKCEAKTLKRFDMFKEDCANYPYLLKRTTTKSYNVKGELYEISRNDILNELDKFEDAPNYYERRTIKVKIYSGEIKKADAYFMKEHKIPKNKEPLEEWIEHKNNFLSEFEKYYKQRSY
jgi:gamma-glutamylcyclotransferase (GGCT)/AIG2-like uncharacterized protein YtfP